MRGERFLIAGSVGIIVLLTILSGPLVGAIDIPESHAETSAIPGTGDATVSDVTIPEQPAEIRAGRFGSGSYYLTVAPAVATVESVSGNPILAYRVSIPDLGLVTESVYFLDSSTTGSQQLAIERRSLAPDRIDRASYDGTITVEIRGDASERVVATRTITVQVEHR